MHAFQLLEVVESVFKLKTGIDGLIRTNDNMLSLSLIQGKTTKIEGTYEGGCCFNVALYYNRSYENKNSIFEAGTWTVPMRPDYTISIWPNDMDQEEAEKKDLITHIHFDAKYKLDKIILKGNDDVVDVPAELQNDSLDAKDEAVYKRTDLLKMHSYKDAIRRTSGAYIIYPGNPNSSKAGNIPCYTEILPGLGAFVLKPSLADTGRKDLEKFLSDILEHLQNRISQREKMAYYDNIVHNKTVSELTKSIPEQIRARADETEVVIANLDSVGLTFWWRGLSQNSIDIEISDYLSQLRLIIDAKYLLLIYDGNAILKSIKDNSHIWQAGSLINFMFDLENCTVNYDWNMGKLSKLSHSIEIVKFDELLNEYSNN